MRTLILLCAIASTNAMARDIWLDVHLTSYHQHGELDIDGKHYDINQQNFGLGLTIPTKYTDGQVNPNMSVRVGFYNNSYNQTSIYGGLNPHTAFTNGFGGGVLLGIVNGYDASPDNQDVLPIIAPSIHYIHNNLKAEMAYLASKYNPALTLTISYKF